MNKTIFDTSNKKTPLNEGQAFVTVGSTIVLRLVVSDCWVLFLNATYEAFGGYEKRLVTNDANVG